MFIDWSTILAVLAGFTGFYTAFSTRRKSAGDVASLAVESAGKSLQMREKDIQLLESRLEQMVEYSNYLFTWTQKNVKSKRPMTFEEYAKHQHH